MQPYTIINSKNARSVRITVRRDGTVTVTKPIRLPLKYVEDFVSKKSQWIEEKVRWMKEHAPKMVTHTKVEMIELKKKALRIAEEKIKYFNQFYKFPYNTVRIKNQKTRWGSCSRKGNLNFNYKLAILPDDLANYLVVHELCHLKEFNHGKRFWDLVGQTVPKYKVLRQQLKKIPL